MKPIFFLKYSCLAVAVAGCKKIEGPVKETMPEEGHRLPACDELVQPVPSASPT